MPGQVTPAAPVKDNAPVESVGTTVTDSVKPTRPEIDLSSTKPAESVVSVVPGQFMTIGGVIAEVNGNPIYADDVLRTVDPVLSARAKELELPQFKAAAAKEIDNQVNDMIRAEVEYAAANRNCDGGDKQLAETLTTIWRDKQITAAKGSIEEARKRAREQTGRSFDDLLKEQFRLNLTRVYYQKRLIPRIQITAADMRQYYEHNKDTLFSEKQTITFRVIKINKDTDNALTKATALLSQIKAGADFGKLAGEHNDDTLLKSKEGLIENMAKGSYRNEAIEKALWDMQPGEVTPVMQFSDGYYLAKLEKKTGGSQKMFEDDEVQKKIMDELRASQFSKMRNEIFAAQERDSVVSKNPRMYQSTIEMATSNYNAWRGK